MTLAHQHCSTYSQLRTHPSALFYIDLERFSYLPHLMFSILPYVAVKKDINETNCRKKPSRNNLLATNNASKPCKPAFYNFSKSSVKEALSSRAQHS